jgi:hypothetical protein
VLVESVCHNGGRLLLDLDDVRLGSPGRLSEDFLLDLDDDLDGGSGGAPDPPELLEAVRSREPRSLMYSGSASTALFLLNPKPPQERLESERLTSTAWLREGTLYDSVSDEKDSFSTSEVSVAVGEKEPSLSCWAIRRDALRLRTVRERSFSEFWRLEFLRVKGKHSGGGGGGGGGAIELLVRSGGGYRRGR